MNIKDICPRPTGASSGLLPRRQNRNRGADLFSQANVLSWHLVGYVDKGIERLLSSGDEVNGDSDHG